MTRMDMLRDDSLLQALGPRLIWVSRIGVVVWSLVMGIAMTMVQAASAGSQHQHQLVDQQHRGICGGRGSPAHLCADMAPLQRRHGDHW